MAGSHGIFHAVHRTGIPWDNGYCESFNSKLRNEFLNGEVFYSLKEAQVLAERWRFYYNLNYSHGSALAANGGAPLVFRKMMLQAVS